MIGSFQGAYRWLSNFWPCRVDYEGRTYPSVENAYQAAQAGRNAHGGGDTRGTPETPA